MGRELKENNYQANWNPFQPNHNIDELVQERRDSSAYALELRLSCTNPSIL